MWELVDFLSHLYHLSLSRSLSSSLLLSLFCLPVALQPKAASEGRKVNHTITQKHHTLSPSSFSCLYFWCPSALNIKARPHTHTCKFVCTQAHLFLACKHMPGECNVREKECEMMRSNQHYNSLLSLFPPYWKCVCLHVCVCWKKREGGKREGRKIEAIRPLQHFPV